MNEPTLALEGNEYQRAKQAVELSIGALNKAIEKAAELNISIDIQKDEIGPGIRGANYKIKIDYPVFKLRKATVNL